VDDFSFVATGQDSDYLQSAFLRYLFLTFGSTPASAGATGASDITGADVNVKHPSLELSLETDQSYTLAVSAPRVQVG